MLLIADGRTLIVEVKWNAEPGPGQLCDQYEAVRRGGMSVVGMMLLGHASVPLDTQGLSRCVSIATRTWRDVAWDLGEALRYEPPGPLRRWEAALAAFLQATVRGRVFASVSRFNLKPPGKAEFAYRGLGAPPWFRGVDTPVQAFGWSYEKTDMETDSERG